MSICSTEKFTPHLVVSDSIRLVNQEQWNDLARHSENLFLQYDYLVVLEERMHESMEFRYVVFYCENYNPIGIAYFQSVDLIDKGSQYSDRVKKLGDKLGSRAIQELKARILLNGNVFHCGANGFFFHSSVSQSDKVLLIDEALHRLKGDQEMETRPTFLMLKEYDPDQQSWVEPVMRQLKYHDLHMDMNMCLDIDPEWGDFDAYMKSLTSKARTRVKRIMKLSDEVVVEAWEAPQIEENIDRIDRLFEYILEGSVFQFGRLDVSCYSAWKETLKDKLLFKAFLLQGELVGFSTAFKVNGHLEAQYVGIDPEVNKSHSLYLRMLFEYLKDGIDLGVEQLNLGRTAEQAKSSLGAKPVDMMLYVRHRSKLANRFLGPILRTVKPTEFEQRDPFKQVSA